MTKFNEHGVAVGKPHKVFTAEHGRQVAAVWVYEHEGKFGYGLVLTDRSAGYYGHSYGALKRDFVFSSVNDCIVYLAAQMGDYPELKRRLLEQAQQMELF